MNSIARTLIALGACQPVGGEPTQSQDMTLAGSGGVPRRFFHWNPTRPQMVIRSYSVLLMSLAALCITSHPCGAQITVDLNSVNATGGNVDATALLGQYGITLSGVTSGTQVVIMDYRNLYGGQGAIPSPPPNLLTQVGSDNPISYTFNWASPISDFAFTRPMLIAATSSGVTHPLWNAYAYNASGQIVATVGEPLIASFSNVPAANFTLSGTDITSVQIDSNCEDFAGVPALLMNNLTYTPSSAPAATPEPSNIALFSGMALGSGIFIVRRKRRLNVRGTTLRGTQMGRMRSSGSCA